MAFVREEPRGATRARLTKDERRLRILEAAGRVFADRGYEPASLDEIAEAAGITKPVIYDHFPSKRELHMALLEGQMGEMLEFLSERILAEATTERRLAAAFEGFFEFVETHPYAWRLIFRDPTAGESEIEQLHQRIQGEATGALATMVAADDPVPHPDDPFEMQQLSQVVAQVIKTGCNGLAAWWYEHREVPREALVTMMMNITWVGLERMQVGERWSPPASEG